ncbi:MAG: hypothetical protein A2289_17685 [Deltaproteobacteria bacterium RIFOXYA12_FULL_58_15]|nr:MAG: hypothetical protein A2289_17685 [Deltaproteobacteria bacterium RIFOXYA12_FULL_58_15]
MTAVSYIMRTEWVLVLVSFQTVGACKDHKVEDIDAGLRVETSEGRWMMSVTTCLRHLTNVGSFDSLRGSLELTIDEGESVSRQDTLFSVDLQTCARQLSDGQVVTAQKVNRGDLYISEIVARNGKWDVTVVGQGSVIGPVSLTFRDLPREQFNHLKEQFSLWNEKCAGNVVDRRKNVSQ